MLNKKIIVGFATGATLFSGLAFTAPTLAVANVTGVTPSTGSQSQQQNPGQSDEDFKKAYDEAKNKQANAALLKQIAEGSVEIITKNIAKASGAEKIKLQEQLVKAKQILTAISTMNDKATSVVNAYKQADGIRTGIKDLKTKVATAQSNFDKLQAQQQGPSGNEAYNNAAKELGNLQKQLNSKNELLKKAEKGIDNTVKNLEAAEQRTTQAQNPETSKGHKFNISEALAAVNGEDAAGYKLSPINLKGDDPAPAPQPKSDPKSKTTPAHQSKSDPTPAPKIKPKANQQTVSASNHATSASPNTGDSSSLGAFLSALGLSIAGLAVLRKKSAKRK